MLLYVAGPYRGDVRRNIARAGLISARLWELGHTVICPHLNTAHFELLTTVSNEQYVERDLEIVRRVDGLVMVPGWRRSQGARAERGLAWSLEKPIWEWPQVPLEDEGLTQTAYVHGEGRSLMKRGGKSAELLLFRSILRAGLLDGLLTTPRP